MPNEVNPWELMGAGLAGQAAGGALGAVMGLALEGHNDRRQLRQQEKLQNLQIKGQQAMTDYNYSKQMEMWRNTNYGAQVEQLNKAGLNPGLLYGMGGAGGATTGGASGSVQGASAPSGGGEVGMGIQQGLNQAMMMAQIENIKADTGKKKVETAKTGGVDTEEAKTRIKGLLQGVKESEQKTRLTSHMANIQALDDQIRHTEDVTQALGQKYISEAEIAAETAQKMINENQLTENQWDNLNEEIELRIGTMKIAQVLIASQNAKTLSDIKVNYASIQKLMNDINVANNRVEMDKIMNQFKIDNPGMDALESGTVNKILEAAGVKKNYKFKQR